MMMLVRTSLLSLLLAALASCQSPLETDTPRIDIRIRNAVKLQQMSVSVMITRGRDSATNSDWRYTFTRRTFTVDTSTNPPRFGMDCVLTGTAPQTMEGSDTAVQLKQLRLRFSDVNSEGEAVLGPAAPTNGLVEAVVMLDDIEHTANAGSNVSGTFHYLNGGRQEISGTLFSSSSREDSVIVMVAVNFRAHRD